VLPKNGLFYPLIARFVSFATITDLYNCVQVNNNKGADCHVMWAKSTALHTNFQFRRFKI